MNERLKRTTGWCLVLSAGLYMRLTWIRCALGGEHLRTIDPDDLYHLRQILWGASHFPTLPIRDAYLPGGVSPWPGGFDWILAGILRIGSILGIRSAFSQEILAASLVTALSLLAVVFAVRVARPIFGDLAGWIAGFLVAVTPASVDYAMFGRVDHQAIEPVILLVGLDRTLSARFRGILMGLSLTLSQSAILPVGLAAIFLLVEAFQKGEDERRDFLRTSLWALGAAIPSVVTVAYAHGIWFDHRTVGLFQLSLMGFWALVGGILVSNGKARKVLVAVAMLILLVGLGRVLSSFQLLSENPVTALATETRSVFDVSVFSSAYFTDLFFLVPLLLIWLIYSKHLSWLMLTLAAGLAATVQIRFSSLASAIFAVGWGGALVWATRGRAGIAALILFISLRPFDSGALPRTRLFPNCVEKIYKAERMPLMDYLRTHTPDPGGDGDPMQTPDYRILAPWYLGHHLLYLAGRAPVATPFLFDLETPGLIDTIRFFYVDSPEEAFERLRRLEARYVIVAALPDPYSQALKQTRMMGDPGPGFFEKSMTRRLLNEEIITVGNEMLQRIHQMKSFLVFERLPRKMGVP